MNALAFALATAIGALFSTGLHPIDTAEAPKARLRAQACGECHPDEYSEWRSSRHSVAWTNGLFQRDYQRTPRAWCRNCHIPLAAQQAELAAGNESGLVTEGVSCAVCHVRGEVIVARTRRDGSPHDTRVDLDFGSAKMCAGCHQFNFPRFGADGALTAYTDEPMQDTFEQFARNPRAPERCLDCHGSAAGHRFAGAHDDGMLAAALELSVCRDGDALRTTVRNVGAGHNVPTGDVHRHLLVTAWYSTAPADLQQAFYGRRYALTDDGTRTTTWDSTIPPGAARRWRVPIAKLGGPAAADEPINVELRYVYTESEHLREDVGERTYAIINRMRSSFQEVPTCAR